MSSRKIQATAAVAGVLMFASACGSDSGGSSGGGGSADPVEISIFHGPIAEQSLPVVAVDNDLFPDDCTVSLQTGDGNVGISLIGSGRVQGYLNAAPVPEQVAQGGAPVQWVATYQPGIDARLIAQPGITSVADLKGKTIGIVGPTGLLWTLTQAALRDAGLSTEDVTALPLGGVPAVNSAFVAGTVDAIVSTGGSVAQIVAQKPDTEMLFDYSQDFPWIGGGIAVNSDWADENPDGVTCMLTGLNRAVKLIKEDPETAKASVAKVTGQTGPALDASLESMQRLFTDQLEPVSPEIESTVMEELRGQGLDWATDEYGQGMIGDSSYVEEAVAND